MPTPFWLTEESTPYASHALDGVDVEIIGAGITGCSCALALAQAGLRVRIVDQRGVAEGASGRNGGFALRGGAARYDVARETYGVDVARMFWQRTERALDELETLAGDALTRPGSLRLAADDAELPGVHEVVIAQEDNDVGDERRELGHGAGIGFVEIGVSKICGIGILPILGGLEARATFHLRPQSFFKGGLVRAKFAQIDLIPA